MYRVVAECDPAGTNAGLCPMRNRDNRAVVAASNGDWECVWRAE